jgi:hypothetical protein
MVEIESKSIDNSSLEKLLKENIELNQKIYESCQKTEKYIFFIKAFNIFKFIIIFIPVILGIFYVIPLLGGFIDMYKDLLNNVGETTGILNTMKDVQGINGL